MTFLIKTQEDIVPCITESNVHQSQGRTNTTLDRGTRKLFTPSDGYIAIYWMIVLAINFDHNGDVIDWTLYEAYVSLGMSVEVAQQAIAKWGDSIYVERAKEFMAAKDIVIQAPYRS